MQVHKENIDKVPNSIKGREDINVEICGMENIPQADLIEHERQRALAARDSLTPSGANDNDSDNDSQDDSSSEQPSSKRSNFYYLSCKESIFDNIY
jgi:hypothetical protein